MNRSGKVIGNSANQQQNITQHLYPTYSSEQQNHQNILSTATNLLSGGSNAAPGGIFGNRSNFPKGPQVVPHAGINTQQQHTQSSNSKIEHIFFKYSI